MKEFSLDKNLTLLSSDVFEELSQVIPSFSEKLSEYSLFPGFCDVHVHFRKPGFSYKESIYTGSLAAAHGGYTAVCTMPNLSPAPDGIENLKAQTDIIKEEAIINVYPYGTITVAREGKELSDMESLAGKVIAFSDDGSGVQSEEMMLNAMMKAKALGAIIAAHCEDNSLLFGGCIHDGKFAKENGFKGISSESEYKQIERDLALAEKTGCKYHVCHISTKESVKLIANAKKRGVDVTCETAPHYLVLDDSFLRDEGCFKMNPPLRDKTDREALIEGIKDGTIDMIATDHAPHILEEKSKGLKNSAFGIVGLESAFPLMYTKLVKTGIITMDKLLELMVYNPKKRFNIPDNGDYTIWDLNKDIEITTEFFLSKGKSSPFINEKLKGECVGTIVNGKLIWHK